MSVDVHPKWVRPAGLLAFFWRLVLTTGTGSIFGWLVARPGYDAAIMAPLFIAMSFALGLACFVLVLLLLCRLSDRELGAGLIHRLNRLMAVFIAGVLYFTAVQHLTNLYAAEHSGVERFILAAGGVYTFLFWVVQIFLGALLPLALIFSTDAMTRGRAILVSALVILGGAAQFYVIIIGGQAYPMEMFPGYEVSSGFFDGEVAGYAPSLPELLLGLGGVAVAVFATGVGAKVLRILPTNLGDRNLPAES
jgi:molybdopterin-containing oxidoreductase family membrane subunit